MMQFFFVVTGIPALFLAVIFLFVAYDEPKALLVSVILGLWGCFCFYPLFMSPDTYETKVIKEYKVHTVDNIDFIVDKDTLEVVNLNKKLGMDLEEGQIVEKVKEYKKYGCYESNCYFFRLKE